METLIYDKYLNIIIILQKYIFVWYLVVVLGNVRKHSCVLLLFVVMRFIFFFWKLFIIIVIFSFMLMCCDRHFIYSVLNFIICLLLNFNTYLYLYIKLRRVCKFFSMFSFINVYISLENYVWCYECYVFGNFPN